MAQTFTTDLVRRTIKRCINSKAFGPDKPSIFHLNHLRPRAIEYITALFNLSVTTCQIPAIWKSSLIISIPNPGNDTYIGTLYRPILLLCPSAKVPESMILPTIKTSPTDSRPTRFQTGSLDHLSSNADDNIDRHGIQPEEARRSNDLRSCRFIG